MNQHYFDVPFAFSGDVTAIPDPLQTGGTVSFTEGWNYNYQRDLATDPAALPIDRSTMNWLLLQITTAIQALQQNGVPEFILASQNGGTAYSYAKGAVVNWSASGSAPFTKFVCIATGGNTNTPSLSDPTGATTGWQLVVDPISTSAQAATGTDNASIMTPLLVAQQTALRALLAGSAAQVFNVATATAPTHAVPLSQLAAGTTNIGNRAEFTSTTTFTVPANVTTIWYSGCAGGGGGGGSGSVSGVSSYAATGGAGGGAPGQWARKVPITVTPGQVLTITIGAGGTHGVGGIGGGGAAGSTGGNTTITGTGVSVTLTGGAGGQPSTGTTTSGVSTAPGRGGGAGASDGTWGSVPSGYAYDFGGSGGSGGNTPFGQSGGATSSGSGGSVRNGVGYGAGGSGGYGVITTSSASGIAGADGLPGYMEFEW